MAIAVHKAMRYLEETFLVWSLPGIPAARGPAKPMRCFCDVLSLKAQGRGPGATPRGNLGWPASLWPNGQRLPLAASDKKKGFAKCEFQITPEVEYSGI